MNTDDGNPCTIDACDQVTGNISHNPVSVDDNDACTDDACNPITGMITHTQVNTDDGDVCTIDACNPVTGMVTHTPVDVNDNNPCTVDACNPVTGAITHTSVNIDDGNDCTIDDCNPLTGQITHTPVTCDDGNACTLDACDPVLGCVHTPVNIDDGQICTIDICNSITGDITHTPKFSPTELDDSNPCTIDYCDEITGLLVHLQISGCPETPPVCCPDFILKDAVKICPPSRACCPPTPFRQSSNNLVVQPCDTIAACKNTPHTYTVYPFSSDFTYTWTIAGGTPVSFTGNPVTVVWGTGNSGYLKVVITGNSNYAGCDDSIVQKICLIDGPDADFIFAPGSPLCKNSSVNFTNTSNGGSMYHWDFGDGTTFNRANPPAHQYTTAGTYKVVLTVTDMGDGSNTNGNEQDTLRIPCGCTDTISTEIVILPDEGPDITSFCCAECKEGTVCPGDTSSFCTSVTCGTYNWVVTGGIIISGAGTNCIKVVWNTTTYPGPTTVSLSTPGCTACDGTTTLNVPVLYPDLPITGLGTLCRGSSGSYSIPSLPGTYYTWTVTGGNHTFNFADRNVTTVNITFEEFATYTVQCIYNNPLADCPSGISTFTVEVKPVFSHFSGNEKVCVNSSPFYFANGTASWVVTPPGAIVSPGNSNTKQITWALPGTYTITATPTLPGDYCNANSVKVVQVVANPILSNINGPNIVCPGKIYEYSVSSNTSGNPFIWSLTGPGSIKALTGSDQETAIIQLTEPGPWTIHVEQKVEISPGLFCVSESKTLVVHAVGLPSIAGPNTVCADDVSTYTAIGGSTPPDPILWTITPAYQGTILTGQGTNSVDIRWHGPTAVAMVSVTTCVGTVSYPVTVNSLPQAIASFDKTPVFCHEETQTLLLSSSAVAGYSYQWFKVGGGQVGTLQNLSIDISLLAIGIHQFYVLITANGCEVKSNIINVIIEDCEPGGPGHCNCSGNGNGCPVGAFFRVYVLCDEIILKEKSVALAPATITGYLWTVNPSGTATFSNANIQNPALTVTASGTYTITLTVTSSTGCTNSHSETVNVLLPVADFSYSTPVCVNTPATFLANPNHPDYKYFWDFGDNALSFTALTQHAYVVANTYNVTLNLNDEMGCFATVTKQIVVHPKPTCLITVSDTMLCPGESVHFTGCEGKSAYQWYRNGNAIAGANSKDFDAFRHGEYWLAVTNNYGCSDTSNHVYIYENTPPKAKIKIGVTDHFCVLPSSTVTFSLEAFPNVNTCTYTWSSDAAATFNSNGTTFAYYTNVTVTMPAVLPVTYYFILNVVDLVTGCHASDTICITFYEKPILSIVSIPYLDVCEGIDVTLTPAPNDPNKYNYLWNNGAKTPVIVVSAPGYYSLTITDKTSGCSDTQGAGSIHPKPDLSLFPLGCDTFCGADYPLYIPLPLNALPPNDDYYSAYPVITWYDNADYGVAIGTGQNFLFSPTVAGSHRISVVVQNSFGCIDTAGVLCLFAEQCCDTVCQDFNNNQLNGWQADPNAPNINVDLSNVGSLSGDSLDYYIKTTDESDASALMASVDFNEWCCGDFCYDYRIFDDGDPDASYNINPVFWIYNGVRGFAFTSNIIATENNGWHRVCASVQTCNFPDSGTAGKWMPVEGTTPEEWSAVTTNITRIVFRMDYSAAQSEVSGFDNVCFTPHPTRISIEASPCKDSLCVKVDECCDTLTYVWSNGSTDPCIGGLVEGTVYTVVATDQNGITYTASMTAPARLRIDCFGGTISDCSSQLASGQIGVTVTGGTGIKFITVRRDGSGGPIVGFGSSSIDQSLIFNNLSAGRYYVYAIDENGCEDSCFTDLICCQLSILTSCENDSIKLCTKFTGNCCAFPAITTWTGPNGFTANTACIYALTAGTYSVTITCSNGNTYTASIEANPERNGWAVATYFANQSSTANNVKLIDTRANFNSQPKNVNTTPTMFSDASWNTQNLTEVFGIAHDHAGNVFVTATTVYGPTIFTTLPAPAFSNGGAVYRLNAASNSVDVVRHLPNQFGAGAARCRL